MGIVVATNPIGVDSEINKIQSKVYRELTLNSCAGWTDEGFMFYNRAYKNPTKDGIIPEVFAKESTSNTDYKEVLLDDRHDATAFFTVSDTTEAINTNSYQVGVSLFFQVNLSKVYPSLGFRADKVAENDVMVALKKVSRSALNPVIVNTVPLVYQEFRNNNLTYDDMHPYHVFRVDFDVKLDYDCYYKCIYPTINEENSGFQYYLNLTLC